MNMFQILFGYCIIPVVDLTRAIGWIKTAAIDLIKWAALRLLIISVVTTLVPLAIYAGWSLISEQIFTMVTAETSGAQWEGTMVQLTGLGAWLGIRLQLVECFQVLSTFLALRFTLSFVR